MSRTLSTANTSGITQTVTRPVWLVAFGNGINLSSRDTIVYDGNTYTAANLRVSLDGDRIELFNEAFNYTSSFLNGTGMTVTVYLLYGNTPSPTWPADTRNIFFSGVAGNISVGPKIVVTLKATNTRYIPSVRIKPPVFNHVPPDGTKILTPQGPVILERG